MNGYKRGLGVMMVLLSATCVLADPADQVERSMRYVDKVSEGTALFNAGKTEQALAIFRELDQNDRDLDEDGYVGLAVGDCLAELKRVDEARQAYQAVLQLHPDLEPRVTERMTKLDVAGQMSEDALSRVRNQAQGKPSPVNHMLLGVSLQKRAYELLGEAAAAFKLAREGNPLIGQCPGKEDRLEELREDLREMIEQNELEWSSRPAAVAQKFSGNEIWFKKIESEWDIRTKPNSPTMKMQLKGSDKEDLRVVVGGKTVQLTEEQKNQIRHRQMQIMNILSEAVGKNK